MQRALTADLDDRDPDYVRENLALCWLLATLWYRAEVRNVGNVPENGPVLLVGNHTGGNMSPEVIVLPIAFSTYFGVERPFYQLAHNLVLASPFGPMLRKYGSMAASHKHAEEALKAGAAVLVFPGGDWEVHRPSWERNKIDLAGRKGFIKLALNADVPIVPVVTIGGQETALFLSRGAWLAKLTGADRYLRLKVLPISLALPWGLNIGDLHGPPAAAGEDHDRGRCADRPARAVRPRARYRRGLRPHHGPHAGDPRRPRFGAPASPSSADAPQRVDHRVRPAPSLSGTTSPTPTTRCGYMSGITRWEVEGDKRTGLGARYRMLMRVGSAEMGGLVEIVEFSEPRDMAWSSITGVDQRGRWRLRRAGGGRTRVEFRFAYGVAGSGIAGYIAEHVAAPLDPRPPAPLAAAASPRGTARALRQQAAARESERQPA